MKRIAALALCLILCTFANAEDIGYDASESIVNRSTDQTAQEFAVTMVEAAQNMFDQAGVKSAIYIYDTFGQEEQEDFSAAITKKQERSGGALSNEIVFVVSVRDAEYAIWVSDDLSQVLSNDVIEAIRAGVESPENETIWQKVSKAYIGAMMRVALSAQAQTGAVE